MPDDYYGHAVIWRTNADGSLVELVPYSMAEWAAVPDTRKTAEYPTRYFIDSNDEVFLWPVPTANPTLKLKYQAITTDAASDSQPDLDQTWMQALGYGVASEVGLKMAAPAEVRLEVTDDNNQSVYDRYFSIEDNMLLTARPLMPSMFTLDEVIIRQDCLGYLMERLLPDTG